MSERYTYAVARIRAMEVSLLSNAAMDQLMACRTYEQCLQFLTEKGWGDGETGISGDAILKREEEKMWEAVKELAIPMEVFDVLTYPKLFHNLKAAIKEVCTEGEHHNIFYDDAPISGSEMLEIVREKDFGRLAEGMQESAAEAYESFLHTKDGQLCDVILDRGALEAIREAGKRSKDPVIRGYAETIVAVADIKIALRCADTGKSLEFMSRAMAECDSLNVRQLAKAALGGVDAVREYLAGTTYGEGAELLAKPQSYAAFERWCDNRIIQTIRPQKYQAFGVGPVVAYVIARQNEIKTVRIILSGKRNELPEESIRERVREMYG